MAPILPISLLSDVRTFKNTWKIQVKPIHIWNQYSQIGGETLEMILADETGTKIHASFKRTWVPRVQSALPLGAWRTIENFSVSGVGGKYRPTNHSYKIVFNGSSSIKGSNVKNDDNFINLTTFDTIMGGSLNTHFLIAVEVGDIHYVQVQGKERKKLEFLLMDQNVYLIIGITCSEATISCCLWDVFAEKVFNAYQKFAGEMILCLIRFAKICFTKGMRVVINKKPKRKRDERFSIPFRSVSEIRMSNEIEKCLLVATVIGNDTDWAWYYFSCTNNNCNKKVTKMCHHNHCTKVIYSFYFIIYIKTYCIENWLFTALIMILNSYKLHLMIKDETDQTKVMLLDSEAEIIVGKSAEELLDGSLEEILIYKMEDPKALLETIKALIGKTFLIFLYIF
ncbi:hypothetical protein N665_0324s0001 [Sinapis alba]|nr:hypothetical protein N665_0324s0001 [Sinapis alba]